MKLFARIINRIRQLRGKHSNYMPHINSIELMAIEEIAGELIGRFEEGIILYIEPSNKQLVGSLKVHAKIDNQSKLKRLLPEVLQNIINDC